MAWEVKYRGEFDTTKGNLVRIDILEDAVIANVTNVTIGKANLKRTDGDLDKFAGVRESELVFSVFGDGTNITEESFYTENDTQYRVYLYVNDEINWKGWLDSSNMRFQLKDENYLIELTARDGLHLLRTAKIADFVGDELFGRYRVTQYIAACLLATKYQLDFISDYIPFNTWIDIYPNGFPVRGAGGDTFGINDPLHNIYVDSGTFRTGVNEYDNPFVILNKICNSFKATFFQYAGEWHFVYVEDWVRNLGLTGTKFSSVAGGLGYESNVFTQVNVGLYRDYKLANDNANVSLTPNYSKVRMELPYEAPPSKIQNQDFSKVDETTIVVDSTNGYEQFDLEDWTATSGQGIPKIMQIRTSDTNPLANGEKWLQFIKTVNGAGSTFVDSNTFLVGFGDMFTIKWETGTTNASFAGDSTSSIIVSCTDGVTTYYLGSDGKWYTSSTVIQVLFATSADSVYGLRNPKPIEISNIAPVPVNGNMTVRFQGAIIGTISGFAYGPFVRKLEVNYRPILGYGGRADVVGPRRELAGGQYYESSEDITTKEEKREDVYIFNAPSVTINGVIMDSNDDLVTNWNHNGVTETPPLMRLIADAVWKSVYRRFFKLESTLLGVIKDNQIFAHLHNFIFDEFPNKIFMLTSIDVDIRNELAEFTCVELLDETNTDDFDELATTRKTGYISDVGGKLFPQYDKYKFREPADYMYGYFGYLVDSIIRISRRR